MAPTGYVYDKRYLRHDTGPGHPERPDRLRVIQRRVVFSGLINQSINCIPLNLMRPPWSGSPGCMTRIILSVSGLPVGRAGSFWMSPTPASAGSRSTPPAWPVGGVLAACDAVMWGEVTNAFCAVRPAGCYPGTGWATERGRGAGLGFTLNFPFPPYSRDPDYLEVRDEEVLPALEKFRPDCLMISAGFDGHALDPISRLRLSTRVYKIMGALLLTFARDFCQGRIISVLEGGYNLEALEDCVFDHIRVLSSL